MIAYNTSIVRDGLVLHLDAANVKSYPGSGTVWKDLSGNGNDFTIEPAGFVHNTNGYFSISSTGIVKNSAITLATLCTCVFWMKTADVQALFWHAITGDQKFLGAYRVANKFYNDSIGTPTFYMDTVNLPNIYDYISDDKWHMIEFKSANLATWTNFSFNRYTSYKFEGGQVSNMLIYDRNLTIEESKQNFEAIRGRYGI